MFEVYNFRNKSLNDQKLKRFLNQEIKNFDHVIVCDFGHGLINSEIIKILHKSKYLSANIQTNSGNRGYNLFTKYKKLDFLSIDEPELRLGLVDKESNNEKLIKKIEKRYKNIMLTRGRDGLLFKKNKEKIVYFPALATNPRDTIGAGDTFMAGVLNSFDKKNKLSRSSINYINQDDIKEALEFASNAASITVSRQGANPPWESEVL